MPLWRQLARGLRALVRRPAVDRELADEVEHYLDETAAALEAGGLSREEARRAARRDLGSMTALQEQVRAAGWEHTLETMAADARYGVRRLLRAPGFTSAAVITLALGIGASTAIFSAVNPVLLRPLPYPDAGRLVTIWDAQNGARLEATFGTYRELVARSRSFDSLAVMRPLQATLTGTGDPERIDGQYVSASYFRTLGVQPALGRDFEEADDQPYQAGLPLMAIISDALWHRRFAADPGIVGRTIPIEDTPVTIVGVLPPDFRNVLSPSAEIWSTLRYDPALPLDGREWGHHLRLVGRLRDDVHPDAAREELDAIARAALAAFPRPSWASLEHGFFVDRLQDDLTRDVRPALLAVLGAVVLLLAIASVNVTNLILARGAERRAELAMRAALGASRWRLTRQLLVETLWLALMGGALGTAFAYGAVEIVTKVAPADLPRVDAIHVDRAALAFALALTTSIGLLVGLGPALLGSRADIQGSVQRRTSRIAGGHRLTRRALVVVQIAVALVLVACAGLLLRSLQTLFAVPPGFDPAHLLTMQVQTAGTRFREPEAIHRFFADVLEAVQDLPGVDAAGFSSQLPLAGDEGSWGVHFESIPEAAAEENRDGYRYAVSSGYLAAMGTPLLAGRHFDARDRAGAARVALINESLARRRLPGLDPIGQRLRIGADDSPWFVVVGVVADVKQTSLASRADAVYVPAEQWHWADGARWLVVRAERDAAALTPAIRQAIRSIDDDQPVLRVATMDERLRASEAERRFALVLFQAFGIIALVLAAVGTGSLLSRGVTERTREIGVRAALGATRADILTLVVRQGMILAALGIAIGLAGTAVASGALATLLFGVSRLDSATYAAAAALLAAASLAACALPAWRAARVAPSIALRSE